MSALASVSPIRSELELDGLVSEWLDHLAAEGKSANTVSTYGYAAKSLRDYLVAEKIPLELASLTPKRLERWQARTLATSSDATANNYHRGLRSLFAWLVAEGELEQSPLERLKAPTIGEKLVPVITTDELRALVRACGGSDYRDLRDLAIVRLFIDAGVRLAELTNVTLDDLDKRAHTLAVTGKGNKRRIVHYGPKAAVALNRYLRARARHRLADSPALWLGRAGPMTRSGLYQIVRARARLAGFTVHPHQFRHTFAHEWLLAGGTEIDLMALCGWSNNAMLSRYGKSAASERARVAHGKLALGERI